MRLERYGVYWVNLDPVIGKEMAKTRPAVVVSDDAMNDHLDTVVVCPVTSRVHPRWPSRVAANVRGRQAEVAVDQIRTIAKQRLGEQIDVLPDPVAAGVRHVITVMYGILSVTSDEAR